MLSWLIFKRFILSPRSGALVRTIAWHCMLGVGIGVAALVIVLSVMNGFNQTIRGRMLSVEPHIVVFEKIAPENESRLKAAIGASSGGIEIFHPFESQDVIVRSVDGGFSGAIAKGYGREAMNAFLQRTWKTLGGAARQEEAIGELETGEILLGAEMARGLGVFEGDDVILIPPEMLLLPQGEVPQFQKFRVKALVDTQMPEFDSKLVFYNIAAMERRLRSLSLDTGYEARLSDPSEAERVKKHLLQEGFKAQTWADRDTSLFFALKMESMAMTLFLSLAVLITSFSIVIVMVLLMNQKRQDIGMMMALGLSAKRTRSIFLCVGLMLSSVGIVAGVALGSAVAFVLDLYPLELLPDIYTDSTLPAKMTGRILLFVLAFSSFIALAGSWLPVSRLKPTFFMQLNRRA